MKRETGIENDLQLLAWAIQLIVVTASGMRTYEEKMVLGKRWRVQERSWDAWDSYLQYI